MEEFFTKEKIKEALAKALENPKFAEALEKNDICEALYVVYDVCDAIEPGAVVEGFYQLGLDVPIRVEPSTAADNTHYASKWVNDYHVSTEPLYWIGIENEHGDNVPMEWELTKPLCSMRPHAYDHVYVETRQDAERLAEELGYKYFNCWPDRETYRCYRVGVLNYKGIILYE